jgi:hypothetical protein
MYTKYGHWVVLVLASYIWDRLWLKVSEMVCRPFPGFYSLHCIPNRTEHFNSGFDLALWWQSGEMYLGQATVRDPHFI